MQGTSIFQCQNIQDAFENICAWYVGVQWQLWLIVLECAVCMPAQDPGADCTASFLLLAYFPVFVVCNVSCRLEEAVLASIFWSVLICFVSLAQCSFACIHTSSLYAEFTSFYTGIVQGKFIRVNFDNSAHIVGASIDTCIFHNIALVAGLCSGSGGTDCSLTLS